MSSAKKSGVERQTVMFRGVPTLGFAAEATQFAAVHCCDACDAAGGVLPGHGGCSFDTATSRLIADGLADTRLLDGQWAVRLTAEGVEAFREEWRRRRLGAARGWRKRKARKARRAKTQTADAT